MEYTNVNWFYENNEKINNEQKISLYEIQRFLIKKNLQRYFDEIEFYENNVGIYIGYDINKYGVKKHWL